MNNQTSSLPVRATKRTLRYTNRIVDGIFVVLMLFLLLVAIYIKMDSDSVYQAADPRRWIQYKPELPDDVETFEDLQKKNEDIIGWLTLYGTTIDYPLLYAQEDNNYYLNHNALKEPESSGSIFLDYRNQRDFSDFNNILHGHHMAEHKMFGDLDLFAGEEFFRDHEFGNLFFNGDDHGVQILAVILTDGYDSNIYKTGIRTDEEKVRFINYVYERAKLIRGVDLTNKSQEERARTLLQQGVTSPITPRDTILTLSTCNLTETNGRYIVIAKLLDHTVPNPYEETDLKKENNERIDTFTLFNRYGSLPLYVWFGILLLLILLTYILYKLSRRRDRKLWKNRKEENGAYDQNE